ncbi:MAG: hypothetical protein ABI685_08690 [Ferruginibacter sp.]
MRNKLLILLVFCFISTMSNNCLAQTKRVELNEMKDTVNLLISTIKELEKSAIPDKKKLDDTRTRLIILVIYNSDSQCGVMPPPSAKIELFELYWKCLFDNALYGKKFMLS